MLISEEDDATQFRIGYLIVMHMIYLSTIWNIITPLVTA